MKKNPIKLESKNFKIAESTHGILHLVPKSETQTKKLRNNYKRQFNKIAKVRSFLQRVKIKPSKTIDSKTLLNIPKTGKSQAVRAMINVMKKSGIQVPKIKSINVVCHTNVIPKEIVDPATIGTYIASSCKPTLHGSIRKSVDREIYVVSVRMMDPSGSFQVWGHSNVMIVENNTGYFWNPLGDKDSTHEGFTINSTRLALDGLNTQSLVKVVSIHTIPGFKQTRPVQDPNTSYCTIWSSYMCFLLILNQTSPLRNIMSYVKFESKEDKFLLKEIELYTIFLIERLG